LKLERSNFLSAERRHKQQNISSQKDDKRNIR